MGHQTQNGCGSGCDCNHGGCSAEAASDAPADLPHPAKRLQDSYVETMRLYAKLEADVQAAAAVAEDIGFRADIHMSRVKVESISKCAVEMTVRAFAKCGLRERAALEADEEFARAFGDSMYHLIEEGRGCAWERLDEDERSGPDPGPYVVDLPKLWDSMVATYSDGGATLARRQAATTIRRKWDLDRMPLKVVKDKAQIDQRVSSEKPSYGLHRFRRVSYSYDQDLYKLFQALDVFLSWAGVAAAPTHTLNSMRVDGNIEVNTGASHLICSLLAVRTFNEHWRWTIMGALVAKLHEFFDTYGAEKT